MKNSDPSATGAGLGAEQRPGLGAPSIESRARSSTLLTDNTCRRKHVRGWGIALLAFALLGVSGLVWANVGRTAGTFQVDQNGAATYTIPIFAPRGPNNLEPHIALVYSSLNPDSYVAPGWSIAGLSEIYRCDKTVAQDGAAAPVALQTSDGYCLDSQRLRLTSSGNYGTAGSTYQTEIANFAQVTAEGSTGNGPQYWEVQGKDGLTYEYGNGGNSQVIPGTTGTAYEWWLDKVTDRAGNTMTFAYSTSNASGEVVPKTISWTPSGQGSSQYEYTMAFSYTATAWQYGFVDGVQVYDTNRLQSIAIQYYGTGTTVKEYFLTQQPSPTTSRELLASLQECTDSTQTNCLPATQFTYQAGQTGVSSAETAISATATDLKVHNDFNGDGKDDLSYCTGGSPNIIYVAFASSSGYGTPVNTGIPCNNALYGDLTGSGRAGILVPNGTDWVYYTWNGSSFSGQDTGLAYDSTAAQYVLADVNGDGLPDLLAGYQTNTTNRIGHTTYQFSIYVRMNSSSGGSPGFSTSQAEWYSTSYGIPMNATMIADTDYPYGTYSYGTLKALDFNGDGKSDIAMEMIIQYASGDTVNTYEMISGASGFTPTLITSGSASSFGTTAFLDFNSDKCTDYAYGSVIYVSGCDGTVGQQINVGTPIIGVMDWNGDGLTDVLVQNGSTVGVYLSEGNTVSSLVPTSVSYSSSNLYFAFDANGDRLDDLGVYASTGTVSYYLHSGPDEPPDLLSSITDGYGNTIKPTYVSTVWGVGSTYTPASSAPSDYELFTDPLYIVNVVTYSDPSNPPNGTYTNTHSYSGGLESLTGRGFAGFATHTVLDSRNSLSDEQGFGQVFPYTGMLTSDVVTDTAHSAPVSSVSNTPSTPAQAELSSTPNEEIWFPYVSSSTRQDYEVYEVGGSENGDLISTTTSSFNYDTSGYGDLTASSQTVTDNDPGSPYNGYSWSTSVTNTPDADASTWCLPLLNQSQVTYSDTYDNISVRVTKDFTPDLSNCRYTQIVTAPGTTYQVSENLGYDGFGNISSDIVTGTGMSARESTANWGATGQLPVTLQDPVGYADGYETQIGYDYRFGLKISEVETASGVQNAPPRQWSYDSFGRFESETQPDNTATAWSYSLYSGSDPKPRMVVTEQSKDTAGNVIRTTTEELDMLDRPYLAQTELINGSTDTVMQKGYDSLGRVVSEQEPYVGSPVGAVTSSYDALNRLIETQRSTAPPTTYQYAGWTTTITDANGHAKTLIYDVNGWLRETKDATGYAITLGYDAAGSHVLTTDNQGNDLYSATIQYGIAPFTVAATDADFGKWKYTVDPLGEITAWTDAKGQNFSAAYDALSRMTDRYEPDLYSHWTWGSTATANNIGQLQSVCTGTGTSPTACTPATGYAENEIYDTAARPNQRSITIPGDATYTYTQTYNADGLPDVLTYPVSTAGFALTLKFGYAYGVLNSITDTLDNVTLWTANSVDALGQYTQETFGNGVVVNHAFDPMTGLPQSITAGVGGGATLQDNAYMFDAVGNLTQRQDLVTGTTESVYPDSLNRLDHTVGDTNTTMTYDAMGRIASWQAYGSTANVQNYATQQSGCTYYANAQPHAVRESTQAPGGSSFCYDANGNMTEELSLSGSLVRSFTWTSFNQPSAITAPGYNSSSQFLYDENHQRFEQIASYSDSAEDTEYIGGLMEKMTNSTGTTYRYYVPAGNNFIVYNRWASGTNAIDYAIRDHIGSTAVITDSNGKQVVAEKFSALGWGENNGTTFPSITRHEFTGQEGLDNYGLWLVDMNGRIYNSSGAYFYSPDPYIQDPTNTQNYDRYSYVYNNPLTHVDPSGFAVGDVEGACSGGYFGDDFGGYSIDLGNNTTLCLGGGLYAGLWDSRNGASSSGNGGGGAGGNTSGKPNLPQQSNPCAGEGKAPPPQYFQQAGQELQQQQQLLQQQQNIGGAPWANGLAAQSWTLGTLSQFARGGSLDAQAYNGPSCGAACVGYGNYAFGVFMSAAGYSLQQTLGGANAYGSLFSSYKPGTPMATPSYPSIPAANAQNITAGYSAQQSGQLCHP